MKQMKKFPTLAACALAFGFLLGTSIAQAEEVCYESDGVTASGIKGLEMLSDQFGSIVIDVDFRYATGFDIYGPDLNDFPFDAAQREEDAALAMAAINQTLSTESPVPDFAGLSGQNTYYIGVEEETGLNQGFLAVWGGANYTGDQWAPCEKEGTDDCLLGAGILNASNQFTYADLTRTDGSTCDAGPPSVEFDIIPGISGSWYDPARNREGYAFEVMGTPGNYQMNAYFYTYDEVGNQMWVNGIGPVDGGTAVVPMIVTSGTVFGPGFDEDDILVEEWGTMTFTFSSCLKGTGSYTSIMGNGTIKFDRLTYIAGVACP